MSVGSLIYAIRKRYGRGLRVTYYRDVVRPRTLGTPPVQGLSDSRCEIHVLTSQQDWLNLMWALKSFYAASGRRYALAIHDDGSLDAPARSELSKHFPDARLIDRPVADREVLSSLVEFPRCRAFRETNRLSPKVFDFRHYLRSERLLLFDSDVLFFAEPRELLRRIESSEYRKNSVNEDSETTYTVDAACALARCDVKLVDRFNSGMGLIHTDSLRLDWMEEFLGLPDILGHFWRVEQTLFCALEFRFGVEMLPPEYSLSLTGRVGSASFRHYVGRIRHMMYGEGMRQLTRRGFLQRS